MLSYSVGIERLPIRAARFGKRALHILFAPHIRKDTKEIWVDI
jgi:hypothetical protein